MNKKDLERVIDAFKWCCPNHTWCRRLDGTKYHYECFARDCQKHNGCSTRICKRLRKFINILKEPEQDSYACNYPETKSE